MAGGRPTKYDEAFIERAHALAESGATDREIAQALGIDDATLYRWKNVYREFCEAIRVGKDRADDRVEMALYRKATGYSFDAEKIFQNSGQIVRTSYVEHVPPSDTAAIFWLKNRRGDQWRDKHDVEHGLTADLAAIISQRRAKVTELNSGD
jgi:hypothetical protein